MANSTITPSWTQLIWHVNLLHKAHHSLLALRNNSTSAFCLGTILSGKITKKKGTKNVKIWPQIDPNHGTHLQESWNRMAEHQFVRLSSWQREFSPLCAKIPQALIWGFQINLNKYGNSKLKNLWKWGFTVNPPNKDSLVHKFKSCP